MNQDRYCFTFLSAPWSGQALLLVCDSQEPQRLTYYIVCSKTEARNLLRDLIEVEELPKSLKLHIPGNLPDANPSCPRLRKQGPRDHIVDNGLYLLLQGLGDNKPEYSHCSH